MVYIVYKVIRTAIEYNEDVIVIRVKVIEEYTKRVEFDDHRKRKSMG